MRENFMNSRNLLGKFVIGILVLLFSSLVYGQDAWDFPDFSATQVLQSSQADMSMKVYRLGSSVRIERSGALSTLYVPAKGKVYNFTVYPDHSRQCVAMNPQQARMLPSPLELLQGKNLKRTPAGTQVAEGHSCTVENVVVTQADGTTIKSKVWEADDLKGVPVKIESYLDGVTLQAVYRDITIGAPSDTLFIVPGRCTAFEKMGQVAEVRTLR
jgi:hypothetical protein